MPIQLDLSNYRGNWLVAQNNNFNTETIDYILQTVAIINSGESVGGTHIQGNSLPSSIGLNYWVNLLSRPQPWAIGTDYFGQQCFITPIPTMVSGVSSNVFLNFTNVSNSQLSQSITVWEVEGMQPMYGGLQPTQILIDEPGAWLNQPPNFLSELQNVCTFTPTSIGRHWIEAETLLLDGTRMSTTSSFYVKETVTSSIYTFNPTINTDSTVKSWYKFNGDYQDSKGFSSPITAASNVSIDGNTFIFPSSSVCLYVDTPYSENDCLSTTITSCPMPNYFSVEMMIYIKQYNVGGNGNCPILKMEKGYPIKFFIIDNTWNGPYIDTLAGTMNLTPSQFRALVPAKTWNNLRLVVNQTGYHVYVNNILIESKLSNGAINLWNNNSIPIQFGSENCWLKDLVVKVG